MSADYAPVFGPREDKGLPGRYTNLPRRGMTRIASAIGHGKEQRDQRLVYRALWDCEAFHPSGLFRPNIDEIANFNGMSARRARAALCDLHRRDIVWWDGQIGYAFVPDVAEHSILSTSVAQNAHRHIANSPECEGRTRAISHPRMTTVSDTVPEYRSQEPGAKGQEPGISDGASLASTVSHGFSDYETDAVEPDPDRKAVHLSAYSNDRAMVELQTPYNTDAWLSVQGWTNAGVVEAIEASRSGWHQEAAELACAALRTAQIDCDVQDRTSDQTIIGWCLQRLQCGESPHDLLRRVWVRKSAAAFDTGGKAYVNGHAVFDTLDTQATRHTSERVTRCFLQDKEQWNEDGPL